MVANRTSCAVSSYTLHGIINYVSSSVKIGPRNTYRFLLIKLVNVVSSVLFPSTDDAP